MGLILIMTDSERERGEFYRTLSLKDEMVEVRAFREAPDVVKECQVDLILLDCTVDVDEGLKLLKENKAACPNIPNIFLTDVSLEGVVLKAFRAGARDFFRKPVDIQELHDTIEGLLTLKRASKEKRSPFIKSNAWFFTKSEVLKSWSAKVPIARDHGKPFKPSVESLSGIM